MPKNTLQVVLVFTLLVAVTVIIAIASLDLKISRLFYIHGIGFPYGKLQPWRALYINMVNGRPY